MTIQISYTPQTLTPPFAFAAVMSLDLSKNRIFADLSIEYLNRDQLTKEEIEEEGFSENDNYNWSGTLNPAWTKDITELTQMNLLQDPDSEIYFHLKQSDTLDGFPAAVDHANRIFQELLQAILEQDQIEAPLSVKLLFGVAPEEVTWEFQSRTIRRNGETFKNWEWGRDFMEKVYAENYAETKFKNQPKAPAILMEGTWYPLIPKVAKVLEAMLK